MGARSGGQKIVISLQRAKHPEPHAETACDATRARGDVKSPGPKRTFSLYSANIPGHSVAQYLRTERHCIVSFEKQEAFKCHRHGQRLSDICLSHSLQGMIMSVPREWVSRMRVVFVTHLSARCAPDRGIEGNAEHRALPEPGAEGKP